MEFVNEFMVPTDIETAWGILTDLERVAPCLPGAVLDSREGDTYTGRVKVKVGPISVSYGGQARLLDVDPVARTARIEASGSETKGAGTASADVRAALTEVPGGTSVRVVTDLALTGKPAQLGSGVMAEVGTKIIGTFAQRLEAMVRDDVAGVSSGAASGASATGGAAAGSRPAEDEDVLDLLDFAGGATLKRLLPVVGAVAVVLLVLGCRRR